MATLDISSSGVGRKACGAASDSFTVNPDREHAILHLGYSDASTVDTNIVYVKKDAAATASVADAANEFVLLPGYVCTIPPGWHTINMICSAGAPIVQVFPSAIRAGKW